MGYGCIARPGAVVAVTLALLALSACNGGQSRMAAHIERGKQYLEEGNYKKGGLEFRNALQIDPKNLEARILSGRVAEQSGDYREAIGAYRAALEVDEHYAPAQAALGRIMVFAGEPAQALDLVAPGLARNPNDADLLTVRAAARLQQKDTAGARADAELAFKLAPQNENAVALLASFYRQAKDFAGAEKILREAVERSPKSVDLREVLAVLYSDMGEGERVEQQLRKVVELRPGELPRRMRLALYYARMKRPDEAQQVLVDAVKAMPDDDQAKLQLVDFVASQRSRAQGEKTLREFIAADPANDDLRLGLGALLQRSAANAEALAVYKEIVARDETGPKSLVARDRIAAMQIAAGQLSDAARTIDDVLARNPRDLDSLTMRGNLALERNDPTAAIADLRAVLREQPQAVMVRRSLARAHLANREPALAEDTLREALRAMPNDVAIRVDLAQLLGQTNRLEQAVSMLQETVRLAPADVTARESLVRVYIASKDLEAARTAAEDLKTLRPDSASGPYLAGLILQAQNRPDDSQKEFERALELQPAAMDALAALTRLEIARGRVASAESRVRTFADANPTNAVSRNLLGEILVARKAYAPAMEQFSLAIASQPKWPVAHRNLVLAKVATNDTAGAVAACEAGVKATGYSPDLVADLAALYERQGKFEAAIAAYDDLDRRSPGMQIAANNLAMLLVTYRKDKPSLDRARKLTEQFSSSDAASLLDTHGWVRLQLGEVDAALPVLERALSRAPESRVIRYHLGMAQLKAGQRDKARDTLESALDGAKPFTGIDEARNALADLNRRTS